MNALQGGLLGIATGFIIGLWFDVVFIIMPQLNRIEALLKTLHH
jgi:hypothetical protein